MNLTHFRWHVLEKLGDGNGRHTEQHESLAINMGNSVSSP